MSVPNETASTEATVDEVVEEQVLPEVDESTEESAAEPTEAESLLSDGQVDVEGEEQTEPIEYEEFELPDGFEIDEELLALASPQFAALGLEQKDAQELINLFSEVRKIDQQRALAQVQSQRKADIEAVKNHPELGGDYFDGNRRHVARAIAQPGGQEFFQLMHSKGLDNNPAVFAFMSQLGKQFAEDSVVNGGSRGAEELSPAKRMFPTTA